MFGIFHNKNKDKCRMSKERKKSSLKKILMKSRADYSYSHRVKILILLKIVDSVVPCPEYTLDLKQNYEVDFAYILYFLVSTSS